jgi:hypothetical protein
MPSAVFERLTPAIKRLQTYALDRMATGIGKETLAGLECRGSRALSLYGNKLSSLHFSKNFTLINLGTQVVN